MKRKVVNAAASVRGRRIRKKAQRRLPCAAQFPTAFEFTDELLGHLARQLYAGLVGNFLHNSERNTRLADVQAGAVPSILLPRSDPMSAQRRRMVQPLPALLLPLLR